MQTCLRFSLQLLEEPIVLKLSEKYSKTPAQVLLRWAVQQEIGILPRSKTESRIKENIDIFNFEISSNDISALTSLSSDTHFCWDPEDVI